MGIRFAHAAGIIQTAAQLLRECQVGLRIVERFTLPIQRRPPLRGEHDGERGPGAVQSLRHYAGHLPALLRRSPDLDPQLIYDRVGPARVLLLPTLLASHGQHVQATGSHYLRLLQAPDVVSDVVKGDFQMVEPTTLVVIPTAAAGYVEPGVLDLLHLIQPVTAALHALELLDRLLDRHVLLYDLGNPAILMSKPGQTAQLLIRTEHGDFGSGHHLADRAVTHSREQGLRHIEERQIVEIREIQVVEMVLPRFVEMVHGTAEGFLQLIRLGVASKIVGEYLRVGKVAGWRGRYLYPLQFLPQTLKTTYPLIPELIVMLHGVVATRLKQRRLLTDNLLRRRFHRTYILIATDHSLCNALGRRNAEYAGCVLRQRYLPRLLEYVIQWRERIWCVDLVQIPEVAGFPIPPLPPEQEVVRVHVFPPRKPGRNVFSCILNRIRKRSCLSHGSPPRVVRHQ